VLNLSDPHSSLRRWLGKSGSSVASSSATSRARSSGAPTVRFSHRRGRSPTAIPVPIDVVKGTLIQDRRSEQ